MLEGREADLPHIRHGGYRLVQGDQGHIPVLEKEVIVNSRKVHSMEITNQGLRAESLVPDHALHSCLKDRGLSAFLDVVLSQSNCEAGDVIAVHATSK